MTTKTETQIQIQIVSNDKDADVVRYENVLRNTPEQIAAWVENFRARIDPVLYRVRVVEIKTVELDY